MKIIRNGQEFELTFSELMAAHDEYKLDRMVADVNESYAQELGYEDIELSAEQIRDIAENAIHNLSKNENYFEAYWGSVNYTLKECVNKLLEDNIIKRTIEVDFKNLVAEMENKELALCFVHSPLHDWANSTSVEDAEGNLYCIETYYSACPLNKLISLGAVVRFERVEDSLNDSIEDWERRYMDASDVKDFIKREHLDVANKKVPLDDVIEDANCIGNKQAKQETAMARETNKDIDR